MTSTIGDHLVFLNHLLAEKDRLIAEKDELVVSKDKLWREMHATIRDRDAEINKLRADATRRGNADFSGENKLLATVLKENKVVKKRNKELEHVLESLLAGRDVDGTEPDENTIEEVKDEVEDEVEDVEMDGENTAIEIKHEMRDPMGPLLEASSARGRAHDGGRAIYDTKLDHEDTGRIAGLPIPRPAAADHGKQTISTICTKFTFAPLVTISTDGAYQLAKIEEVAAGVVQAIRRQLETLTLRNRAGKCPACPSAQFKSTGCLWNWMHGSSPDTRWTVEGRRNYACATCFGAGRPCLFWLGNMKWMILPLPPAVRRTDADWRDIDYYINQEVGTSNMAINGVWQPAKKDKRST